jgi:hypothetical protein
MPQLTPRKGMPSPRLNEAEFRQRFLGQFQDPAFESLASELDKIAAVAWDAYKHSRKAPRTRKAGNENLPIQTMIFRSTGWRLARRSPMRSAAMRTATAPPFC